MKTLRISTCALLLLCSFNAHSMSNTVISVKVVNNTFGTMKLKSITGLEVALNGPLITFNVGPGTYEIIDIPYSRPFTLDSPNWQPRRNKVEPVTLDLEFEVHGQRCRLKTRMEAPVGYGVLAPDYKPVWQTAVEASGSGKYRCHGVTTKKLTRPPFSYAVELSINK